MERPKLALPVDVFLTFNDLAAKAQPMIPKTKTGVEKAQRAKTFHSQAITVIRVTKTAAIIETVNPGFGTAAVWTGVFSSTEQPHFGQTTASSSNSWGNPLLNVVQLYNKPLVT